MLFQNRSKKSHVIISMYGIPPGVHSVIITNAYQQRTLCGHDIRNKPDNR